MDVPVGTILDFAGANVPSGYLECDGSAVSRTAYPKLFAAIGTAWGAGDGSTTFNLPDLGGRTCIGKGSRTVGSTGGSETHTLTTSEIPSHTHVVPKHGHANTISAKTPKLTHTITQPAFQVPKHSHTIANNVRNASGGTTSVASTTQNRNFLTETTTTSEKAATDCTRTTNVSITDHSASNCTMSGSVTDKDAFDTNGAGGGSPHSIMQPYAVVRKVIRAA